MRRSTLVPGLLLLLWACGSRATGFGASDVDGGTGIPDDDATAPAAGGTTPTLGGGGTPPPDAATDGPCTPNLKARLRDFVNLPGFSPSSARDDDFENLSGDDRGIVATDLGADLKPVYANPSSTTPTTHGKARFDLWYRDTPGTNISFDFPIVLTPGAGGISTYDNQEFFPLDGKGWNDEYVGDDGKLHNFSFTFELHTTFEYNGGEVFTFIGDDDVFVFVANKLVVDLGGVHYPETKTLHLGSLTTDDGPKAPVPLVVGTTYPLDIFYNERHSLGSHFRMDTSISFNNCAPILVK
jgi:fibro-slime domain-containing protein